MIVTIIDKKKLIMLHKYLQSFVNKDLKKAFWAKLQTVRVNWLKISN